MKIFLNLLFILIPFFIVNGILTGTGIEEAIVWYNNNENISIRMRPIPIEDILRDASDSDEHLNFRIPPK